MQKENHESSMSNTTKDAIQYSTAVLMIVSSVVLSFLSFFWNEGNIADGILWYVAQSLTYAGGIFGVTLYVRTKQHQSENRVYDRLENRFERYFNERDGHHDDNTHFGNQQQQQEEGEA